MSIPAFETLRSKAKPSAADPEFPAAAALLAAAAVVGVWTAGDYGITVDEFNADDYGLKALAWYASGFGDRSMFQTVEETLWYYGPWFHILTAIVQSWNIADHWTIRHAMTFLVGLAGIAALLPMARLGVGRWAGTVAIGLCLTTGYLYGSLFFTPIDVPFLFAMTWSTLAIMVMAQRTVPSWPATIATGLLTGLTIATRSSGIITHAYLVGAMALCAVEALMSGGASARRMVWQIAARTLCAMLVAVAAAIALWPWLQIGNPVTQFVQAFLYFANHPNSFDLVHWGGHVRTTELPWSYIPGELVVRLPEAFLVLLVLGFGFGLLGALALLRAGSGMSLKALALRVARSRQVLIIWGAAILPAAFVIIQGSTLYDAVRHVLFLIPMLAVIAGFACVRLLPLLRRFPLAAAAAGGAYAGYLVVTLIMLHPLEYVAINVVGGGVNGGYGRFDQDYWSVAANTALRRLERRLDPDRDGSFTRPPPSLLICIRHREGMVEPMYRLPWRLEVDPESADYIIETQRSRCARGLPVRLIDEVKRFDRTFAWVYAREGAPDGPTAAIGPR
jgi:hypothetical protein